MCDHGNSSSLIPLRREINRSPALYSSVCNSHALSTEYKFCYSLVSLLLVAALLALSPPAFSNANGTASCGSNLTVNQCPANGAGSEESTADPASSNAVRQAPAGAGNPINLITGNKYQKHTDYQSPSSRLSWQRHYNSSNSAYDFGMGRGWACLLYTSPSPRDQRGSRMPSSA